ncbi:MAG: DUF2783 domain-containing protein [Polaromonas sp.]|nr:DUF2783 domain-containing protein [Polaromonas sp.]
METSLNFQDADAFYENLLDAHQGLSREQSEAFNARLILLMANQIGNTALLVKCITAASEKPDLQAGGRPGQLDQLDRPVG